MADEKSKEKLVKLLDTMFAFDSDDWDHGIYRILNFKRLC